MSEGVLPFKTPTAPSVQGGLILPTPPPEWAPKKADDPYDHCSQRTCGDCFYFAVDKENLKQGDCVAGRPQVIMTGTPQGMLKMTYYPCVQIGGASCAMFKQRGDQ
jgi:hypothetical protein